jgi:hypothetical protein
MTSVDPLRSAFPLRLAQTYGQTAGPARATINVAQTAIRSIDATRSAPDSFQFSPAARAAQADIQPAAPLGSDTTTIGGPVSDAVRSERLNRLVAARVNAPIEFEAPDRLASTASTRDSASIRAGLAFHTRAADRNTAATGVVVGRSIDITA